ncbi:MAG: ribonuclease HII [Thermoplasmatales archaeon]|nr:ribonuclease HII [Thermoplasmatales archaeon]
MGICGVDEAGRGSAMGPLVVAAVYADGDDGLSAMGVRDSKRLTPKAREALYSEIAGSYEFRVVRAEAWEIDAIMAGSTLNDLEMDLFAAACGGFRALRYYADCFTRDVASFSNALSARLGNAKVIASHGGDAEFPIVSAASIVAKVERDRAMEAVSEKYGGIGSGYPSDAKTMGFIENWIREKGVPPREARTSWEPIRKMMVVSRNSKLTDW